MKSANPLVGIIMGSDSDLSVMSEAAKILDEFNIPYELMIVSAHRTPDRMYTFAKQAQSRGVKVIIAGAGGSAHLPGMTASLTSLPVIGVPIQTKTLSGIDSLYSIVQMPPGVPVATVGINAALNAGLLSVKILAIYDEKLLKKLEEYSKSSESSVVAKSSKLEKIGFEKYLKAK
ncbi:5-(carboxyamino)imidazole ribonucleotide mutase [Candidatus Daviesbacteria bacterium]|nr:5-(carboxyamino)imidazole ribonucleotide mutase [Candidatus Daviesbacteria bacterium]